LPTLDTTLSRGLQTTTPFKPLAAFLGLMIVVACVCTAQPPPAAPLEVTLLGELKSSCLDTWSEFLGLMATVLLLLLLLLLTLLELKTDQRRGLSVVVELDLVSDLLPLSSPRGLAHGFSQRACCCCSCCCCLLLLMLLSSSSGSAAVLFTTFLPICLSLSSLGCYNLPTYLALEFGVHHQEQARR
jgi:uncharacterized ion transporter superfamily protein YfcC